MATRRKQNTRTWSIWVLGIALVAAGCTAVVDESPELRHLVSYTDVACPDEITAVILAESTCGYLTVPEQRNQPMSTRTIKLLVTRIKPSEPSTGEPMFVAGTDLGSSMDYGGIAPLAQRVNREVIFLAHRGAGYSEPALACPEVVELGNADLASPTDDPDTRVRYLDAVAGCHRRLSEAGVDLAAYNVSEMAKDAEDLRRALKLETWNVITYGTASRIALEMLRINSPSIRTATLDSPELPGSDPRLVAIDATREAITAVLDACAKDPTCKARYPRVRSSFARALRAVRTPRRLTLTDEPPDGRDIPVRVDPAMLVRLVRQMLSEGAGLRHPRAVPRVLDAVAAGRTGDLIEILTDFVGDGPYCDGYQTRCVPHLRRTPGVIFSTLCHDIAPFADPAAPSRRAGSDLGFDVAYGRSPYLQVCDHWPVGSAPKEVATLVHSDVPVLAVVGAFGPYVRPDEARAGLGDFPNLSLVVSPTDGHNVVAKTDCILRVRNAWVDDPTNHPAISECFAGARVAWDLHRS